MKSKSSKLLFQDESEINVKSVRKVKFGRSRGNSVGLFKRVITGVGLKPRNCHYFFDVG